MTVYTTGLRALVISLLAVGWGSIGCDTNRAVDAIDYRTMEARQSEAWVRDAVIYEIYLRSFSAEGTFEGLERRLNELRELGVTVLWLMPIHPVGEEKRKGELGSPYSIRDYFDVNPEFGTLDDFRRLLRAAHDLGFRVILDLVANHTAWDNPLIGEHPDWYVRNAAGEIIPPNEDWWDVADLDYSNPAVREYMKEVMRYWVEDIGVDGFRCDVAELVPTEFWEDARTMLDDIKPVLMLSEGSLPEHHLHAFDITYAWDLYHKLPGIIHGDDPATLVGDILEREASAYPDGALRLRFKSNHDENAWDAPAVAKWGREGAMAVGLLVTSLPGVPLIYNGDEVGNGKPLPLFGKVAIDWVKDAGFRDFYTGLYSIYRSSGALRRGTMVTVGSTRAEALVSFLRLHEGDAKLVVVNLKPKPVTAAIEVNTLLDAVRMQSAALDKRFGYGDDLFNLVFDDSLTMTLPAFGYAVYDVR